MFSLWNLFPAKIPEPQGGKDFIAELAKFDQWLTEKRNFSLVRFGDGEMKIINGVKTDYSHKKHAEHTYIPESESGERQRKLLHASLVHQADNYIVGIACPCCVGVEKFRGLKSQSKQDEDHLTWANIFVNSNYPRFKQTTVNCLKKRKIVFIGNQSADPAGLPFDVQKKFTVGSNAWVNDYERLLTELSEYIESGAIKNTVFLFCAGVLSNILIYELNKRFPDNTYLDIGSVFDIELGLGKTRKYLKKGKTLRRTCIWG